MPTKSKPKKAPAKKAKSKKARALLVEKPLRGGRLLRQMFAAPGARYTIEEICDQMKFKGKTPAASASATMSVLANPKKTDDPLRIVLNRETRYYAVAKPNGQGPSAKKPPKAESKKKAKSAPAPKATNGPQVAAG